jgi:DNA polymerase-3 subunit alpha
MDEFVHLHLHNEYSLLDGVGTSEQYCRLAKELGQPAVAITNHGNVDGAIAHQKACKKYGVAPIQGCELYVVRDLFTHDKKETRYHVTVLVENETGWQNLLKLLTIANLDGFYYRPRVDIKTLKDHLEGLIVLTGCSMSFLNMRAERTQFVPETLEIVGKERLFFEIMPHDTKEQRLMNAVAARLAKKYKAGLVATNDCHYPDNRSAFYQEVLLAMQSRKKMSDEDRWKFSVDGLYLKTRDEMFEAFLHQGYQDHFQLIRALDATLTIAELCQGFEIKRIEPDLPSVGELDGLSDLGKFNALIDKGCDERLATLSDEDFKIYDERITEELALISEKKFERYFLIVWDLINWCKQNDILTGPGRGSVGGCLIAYLLGITDVDPIKYDLVFSRFLSPDRIDLPDIDMDFEDHKRHLVKKYLQDKYGEFNVVGLSTFSTMKGKGVLRDVSRAYDIPLVEVNVAAKEITDSEEKSCQVKESCEKLPNCARFKKKYPEVVEVACALEGQKKNCGQHAAAVCVSTRDLRGGENCNLAIRSGQIVANWDKDDAEFMGLIKLDILGLSGLSILNETRAMVGRNHGVRIDFNSIDLADKKVYEEINAGHTVGAFQIGANGLSRFCSDMGVDSFGFIVAATALYRPGPLHSGMAAEFVKIKNGEKKVKKVHPIYDDLTKDTLGIIVYQEQVMSIINQLSGIDMATCDKIRKLMAKSKGEDAINKYRDDFIEGCEKLKTVDKKTAVSLWGTILTFGKYGFNKAHSVEYSLITYWDMWLKCYYPNEFIACSLTFCGKDQFPELLKEAKRLKLTPRLPRIGVSHASNWSVDNSGNLFAPFASLAGVGEASAAIIAGFSPTNRRQGFFQALGKPVEKIPGVNKTVISILERIDAFSPVGDITLEEKKLIKELLC